MEANPQLLAGSTPASYPLIPHYSTKQGTHIVWMQDPPAAGMVDLSLIHI